MNWLFSSSNTNLSYTDQSIDSSSDSEVELESKYELESKEKKKQQDKIIRGKVIRGTKRFSTREITIERVIDYFNNNILIIPDFQRIVNEDKIDKMILSYQADEECFNYLTNPLQIIKLDDSTNIYFLIDGQHRFFMYKRLYENKKINRQIHINIINCSSIEEMQKIYMNFNFDNKDIHFKLDDIKSHQTLAKYNILRNKFKELYKKYFKTNDQEIYSLEEFVKELFNFEYLDFFETINDSVEFLISRNDLFLKNYYDKQPSNKFNKKEKILINDKKIFTLKNNNFLNFLMLDDEDLHKFKYLHHDKQLKSTKKVKINNI
jgi:hypothetical protein